MDKTPIALCGITLPMYPTPGRMLAAPFEPDAAPIAVMAVNCRSVSRTYCTV